MSDQSNISWTDASWNPVTGCSKVSAGCVNCYAERISLRFKRSEKPWEARFAEENVKLHPERLDKPVRWTRPRRIFVNSMSDLFHELVPDDFILAVMLAVYRAPQHVFQVLTKRPERMMEFFDRPPVHLGETLAHSWLKYLPGDTFEPVVTVPWPPRNLWLGTSVEDQRAADLRIPYLLRTPAAVRFLSCEPLIGPVDLWSPIYASPHHGGTQSAFGWGEGVNWVIAGGESGPGFRPMEEAWARALRDQAVAAGVPFFFKQSAGLRPETGTLLDGEEWQQFPELAVGAPS